MTVGAVLTFPARPIHGGRVELARPKRGEWFYEREFDGWRAVVHVPAMRMWNRKGEPLTITHEFSKALAELKAELDRAGRGLSKMLNPETNGEFLIPPEYFEWADCEALERRHKRGQGCRVLLDLPLLDLGLKERGYVMLSLFCPAIGHCASRDAVYSVPQYTDGMAVWEEAQQDNRVG